MDSSGDFEDVLDAFGHRYRRRLLVALADHNPQDDDDPQEARVELGELGIEATDETVKIELFHTHLPKLVEYGYIEWDKESGELSKGPEWAEIEPMLRLLLDHQDEFPDDWL